jgi:hypothetical protein
LSRPLFGVRAQCHFNTLDLDELARRFCESIVEYCDAAQPGSAAVLKELQQVCACVSTVLAV